MGHIKIEPTKIDKITNTNTMDYSQKTVKELITLCKEKKIKGYSGKKKAVLIVLLSSNTKNGITSVSKIEAETNVKIELDASSIVPMDKTYRVKKLMEHLSLSKINHEDQVMKLTTLKDAHIYCVIHSVSAQQYGPLIEKFIQTKFKYIKNKPEDCLGDCSKNGKNLEVKVSLGGTTHTKFNFVQIRPSHNCDIYILTAYHLSFKNVESEGELYIFKVPKEDIKKIIASFGGYAHGTIKRQGPITIESLNNEQNVKEYTLRPTINDNCWKALMSFRIHENEI